MYIHTYVQLCGIFAHSGAFLAVFKNFGRIVGNSIAFFTKPENNRPLIKKFNGPTKAHVHTYIQLCGISAHSGAFLAVFKNFGTIVGISMAFFTKPSKRSMGKQKLMYENCRYLIFAAYLSAHSGAFFYL